MKGRRGRLNFPFGNFATPFLEFNVIPFTVTLLCVSQSVIRVDSIDHSFVYIGVA